ncbi:unnamed protein product, partial [Adineta ricciae]
MPTILSQNTRSILFTRLHDVKYQCYRSNCSSSSIVWTSTARDCQIACLTNPQCRIINFDTSTGQCELYHPHPHPYPRQHPRQHPQPDPHPYPRQHPRPHPRPRQHQQPDPHPYPRQHPRP